MAFVRNDDTNIYQVIDGKRCLHAMLDFGDNKFPLEVDGELYFIDDLSHEARRYFKLYPIQANVAYEYSDELIADSYKKDWFEQINFSGTEQDKEHLVYLNS